VGYPLHLVLVAAGIVMLRPFVDAHSDASSLAVGLALAIGMVEFALTTVPGIVLRLSGSLVTGYFDHRRVPAWAWYPLHDQHLAGTILWAVPALGALPFVVLAQRRWAQADAQEAAEVDTVLEAERIAQGEPDRDAPWWLSDPTLRDRFGR
jgi:cytochrome c oxidase assembly factor CtaG